MPTKRTLWAGLTSALLVASAAAQLTSPAPLAWRWYQPTSVPPTGSPVASGDTIYFAVGNRVYNIDRVTGNMKWRFPAVEPINGAFRSAPLLLDGLLIAVADNQTVYAIDPASGALKWTFDMPGKAIGQPVLAGKYIVVAQSDNNIIAIDPANGQAAWSNPLKIHDGILGQLGSNGDDVLVFNQRRELYSISTIGQKPTWRNPVRFDQLPPVPSSVTLGGTIYVNSGPYLIALNGVTGRARWQANTRAAELAFAPAISPTTILVVSRDGQAYAFDHNGRAVGKAPINLGSFPVTQPTTVGDKHFIVPTTNGAVNLVDPTYEAVDPKAADKPKIDPRDVVISTTRVDAPSPDLLWSFLITPLVAGSTQTNTGRFPGGPGGMGPGGMGPGGMGPGGMGPGGPGGPGGMGGQNNAPPPVSVQASAPAVLVGQTLLVPARDGSLLAFDPNTGVDLTAPTVKMLWPSSGDQVSGKPPLELIFKIEDEATGIDVKTLTIEIDGKSYDYGYTRDGFATVRFSTLGANKPLTDGRKSIVLTVADWLGNKTQKTFSLLIDNALPPIVRPGTQPANQPGRGPGGMGPGGMGPGGMGPGGMGPGGF
ncbi:MAG TPA: PQQ-binding-like beta-propeller repeat protein [Fimbriimonas sp.]